MEKRNLLSNALRISLVINRFKSQWYLLGLFILVFLGVKFFLVQFPIFNISFLA